MADKLTVKQRRIQVEELMFKGHNNEEICQILAMKQGTLTSDKKYVRQKWKEKLTERDLANIKGEYLFKSKMRTTHLWNLVKNGRPNERISALRELRKEDEFTASTIAGLIKNAPTVNVNQSGMVTFDMVNEAYERELAERNRNREAKKHTSDAPDDMQDKSDIDSGENS